MDAKAEGEGESWFGVGPGGGEGGPGPATSRHAPAPPVGLVDTSKPPLPAAMQRFIDGHEIEAIEAPTRIGEDQRILAIARLGDHPASSSATDAALGPTARFRVASSVALITANKRKEQRQQTERSGDSDTANLLFLAFAGSM